MVPFRQVGTVGQEVGPIVATCDLVCTIGPVEAEGWMRDRAIGDEG